MKKIICLFLVAGMIFSLAACGTKPEEKPAQETAAVSETAGTAESAFSYVHDPRENPEAMADIVENPDAVYGFSPDPESTRLGNYAEYDWTDQEFVAQAQKERREYHESMESMMEILYRMRDEAVQKIVLPENPIWAKE